MSDIMNSYSRLMLIRVLEDIINWRWSGTLLNRSLLMRFRIRWTELHLEIVRHYVTLIMGSNCPYLEVPSTNLLEGRHLDSFTDTTAELVVCFTQDLQEFFMVPKLNKYDVSDGRIKRYQAVEVLISFLLQLLCYEISWIDDSLKDRIGNLEKELRFLRTVLGDTSLQLLDEHKQGINNLSEEVQGSTPPTPCYFNLLKRLNFCSLKNNKKEEQEEKKTNTILVEFEAVANEAGSLVHSLLFSSDLVSQKMYVGLGVLLNHIHLLKSNIMRSLDLQPLRSRDITPRTCVLDSLLIVDSLLDDLEVLIKRADNQIADVKDQIKLLHQRLVILQSSIKDIRAPQGSEVGELIKQLLMRIGDMACDAEYLIVSFLAGDAPPAYLILRLTNVIHEIEFIGNELQEISKKYENVAEHNFGVQLPLQAKRNSEVDVITVGLEDKGIHILELLLGGTQHLQIIFITGMPGLGKTTIAKKLYNHPSISYRFDRCSFCVISQSFEKKMVLLDILNNPTEMLNMEEESLVEHLYKSLKGRRYLIVMDDIWDSNVWDDLKICFPDDENGSRILITSRNKDVAPPNAIIYKLPPLTNEECWDLLEKKVFGNKPCPHELLEFGKKIAANCNGLPLAVVTVAGVLSTMDKEESHQWRKVGENLASFIFDCGDDTVMQILELSYEHLPEHLKRCFLYLGVFSKFKEIPVQELMRLWVAEGFIIIREEHKKSAENVAEEYLVELIDRNLAIVSRRRSVGGIKTCVIHDLLRDLCFRKCEDENFLKFVKRSTSPTVLSKTHRLIDDGSLSIFGYRQYLRSFHAVFESSIYASNMKLLRVLNFDRQKVALDNTFGFEFLVCLRMRYLCTMTMPASIGSLVSLEFLVVETSIDDLRIPSGILEMMKLRYLRVSRNAKYDADCNRSLRNNLEFLSTINIYNLKDEETLKSSPHLRKLKCNCKVLWDEGKGVYRCPDLLFLTQLELLNMTFSIYGIDEINLEINFPVNIKKLTLRWPFLPFEKIMTAVGRLPKLEVLKLAYEGESGETWETRDGEFQELKFLKLERVRIAQWNVASRDHFPRLQQLVLIDCYNLQKIPSEIGEIASLQLIEVQNRCTKSLVQSARRIRDEQLEMGNEELRVIIKDVRDSCFELLSDEEN